MDEPIKLGLEGEKWMSEIKALAVPIPGTDRSVLVMHGKEVDKYVVIDAVSWSYHDDLLMVASVVLEFVRNYRGGNREES